MKSRRASRRSSFEVRRLKAASDAASSQRRRVGRKTMAGNKLYELSAASKVAGGISGIRSFMGTKRVRSPTVREGKMVHVQRWTIKPLALPNGRASDTICFYSLDANGATLPVARSSQQFR